MVKRQLAVDFSSDESAGDPEEHVSTVGTAVPSPTRSSQTYIHYVPTLYDPDARNNSRFPAPRGREDRYEWTERARVCASKASQPKDVQELEDEVREQTI